MQLCKKMLNLNLDGRQFFAIFTAYFILLGFLSVILAMAGIFYVFILEIYLILGAIALFILFLKNRKIIQFEKSFYLILAISILSIAFFSFYSNPTIFSGRDQGSLSEAAIRLSQNHQLKFSFPAAKEFFNIYGQGKALNFPGFSYTTSGNLITSFSLEYISWLAVFFSIFGLKGLIIANAVSLFIFLLSFYFISRELLEKKPAVAAFFLILTSFVFSWFFKFTLSENLALMLLWFGILEFYLFIKKNKNLDLALSFLSLGLLLFVRIEGLVFLLAIFIILFFKRQKEKKTLFKIIGGKNLILILSIAIIYFVNIIINKAYYLNFAKDIFHLFFQNTDINSSGNFLAESFFSLKVLSIYVILNFVLFGFLGAAWLLKNKKMEKLIPFFILLPSFIYLIDPHISNDHPWMLRRFIFSIIPVSILYGILFLDRFLKRRILFLILIVILVITNLLFTFSYITFKSNDGLLPQIEKISANFKDSDLILIDREATGDAFAMMTGPMDFLFNKQAVYFFNPEDLKKIDQSKFSNIYFIIPDKNMEFYRQSGLLSEIIAQKDYKIEMPSLNVIINSDINFKTPVSLPERETLITHGKIYLLKK